ncbi:ABC transporter permease subunit [Candidatus Nomurabacteria bacterium]|uniref:ABC transporter permease subunit n=1 Tax=Candidatus Dojkabacteria bacterium TaxID=2099670 RepID=A0A955KWD8_9BACT|nr:ABC transporter permease subunit [Candidatus Dojkabacteria bacterium]MCB9790050.1 ABC transporter permease subunit [Candidatus Nomurabacteria bacterium]
MNRRSANLHSIRPLIVAYIVFTFLIFGWELTVYLKDISQIVIVKPSDIYPVMFTDADILLPQLKYTFLEVFWGWSIGSIIGFVLGAIIYRFRKLASAFNSSAVVINSIPIIALSAIIGGFIGTGMDAKIFIVGLLCFFPMFISTTSSLSSAQTEQKDLFWVYNSDLVDRFIKLDLPHALPFILNALKINVVVGIFAAVVSEFFGAQGGIGALILSKKGLYDLPVVWAAIFYMVLTGVIFYFCISLLGKFLVPWKRA